MTRNFGKNPKNGGIPPKLRREKVISMKNKVDWLEIELKFEVDDKSEDMISENIATEIRM